MLIPAPHLGEWVHNFVAEASSFPMAPHDDQVDAMTQILIPALIHDGGLGGETIEPAALNSKVLDKEPVITQPKPSEHQIIVL